MDTQTVCKQIEGCLLEDMDGEMLLYNPQNATTLHLNQSSMMVWQLCDGQRSIADSIELLTEAYPEQAEQIASDVATVVEDLIDRNVLEVVV